MCVAGPVRGSGLVLKALGRLYMLYSVKGWGVSCFKHCCVVCPHVLWPVLVRKCVWVEGARPCCHLMGVCCMLFCCGSALYCTSVFAAPCNCVHHLKSTSDLQQPYSTFLCLATVITW